MRAKNLVEIVYLDRKLIILKAKIVMGKSDYTSFFRVKKFPKNWILNKFHTYTPDETIDETNVFKIAEIIKLKEIKVVFKKFEKDSIKHRKKLNVVYEILAFLAYLNDEQEKFNKFMVRTIYVQHESLYYNIFRDKFDDLEQYSTSHKILEEWIPHV